MRDQDQQLLGAKGCTRSRIAGSEYGTKEKNINLQNFGKFLQKNVVGKNAVENHRLISFGWQLPPKCLLVTPRSTWTWKCSVSPESHEQFCEKNNIEEVSFKRIHVS